MSKVLLNQCGGQAEGAGAAKDAGHVRCPGTLDSKKGDSRFQKKTALPSTTIGPYA